MMLGNFEFEILNELLKGKTSVSDFESRLGVTKRQVNYGIKKINEVLSRHRYEIIRRDYSGDLEFDESAIFRLVQYLKSIQYSGYQFNEKERQEMIISMILYQEDKQLSLYDLSDELSVSRNTVLKDIQNINAKHNEDDIEIKYSRSVGYYIEGNELAIRRFMYELSGKLVQSFHGILGFNKVNSITEEYYYALERIERDLGTKFDDRYFEMLNIMLHMTSKRVDLGKDVRIDQKIFVDDEIISIVEDRMKSILKTDSEVYWFSLMIMSSSVVYRYAEYEYPTLKERVNEFVAIFESKSGIYIRNRTEFVDRLMVHLIPVVYRMLTSIPSAGSIKVEFVYDYQHLINIVTESLDPIEEIIGGKFPATEVQFITMHVAVELMRLSEADKNKKKAVLVSLAHGSMERMLYLQLKQLFDDFEFIGVYSQRQFNELDEDIDIIFTTIPLQTEVPQHMVNSILSYHDASNIVKRVYDVHVEDDINCLIDIIEETMGSIIDDEKRKVILDKYRMPNFLESKITSYRNLADYMSVNLIKYDSSNTIEEAVKQATVDLVKEGFITKDYADELSVVGQFSPNYILGPSLMIPHIDRKEGAIKEGIMMYVLEEPVDYYGMSISLICPLIIRDSTKHTLAISQLHSLAHNPDIMKQLVGLKDSKLAYDLIKKSISDLALEGNL